MLDWKIDVYGLFLWLKIDVYGLFLWFKILMKEEFVFQREDWGIGGRTPAAGRAKQHSGDETRKA